MMNGVIIIDKPEDFTSFDVVAVMRRLCGTKKIGHAGTLDPMATGVLPILIGNATKTQALFPDSDKEYIAEFKLGVTTDTLDSTGEVLSRSDVLVDKTQLETHLNLFRGNIKQKPPMYSAIKKDGKKLYELARKGIEIEREARDITIRELELLSFDKDTQIGYIRVLCSKGTYIRSLCDDLGRALGCGATLTKLRRSKACGFSLNDSINIDTARKMAKENTLSQKLICVDKIFSEYPKVCVSEAQSTRFKNGGSLDLLRTAIKNNCNDEDKFCVYDNQKNFLGLGIVSKEKQELLIYKLLG